MSWGTSTRSSDGAWRVARCVGPVCVVVVDVGPGCHRYGSALACYLRALNCASVVFAGFNECGCPHVEVLECASKIGHVCLKQVRVHGACVKAAVRCITRVCRCPEQRNLEGAEYRFQRVLESRQARLCCPTQHADDADSRHARMVRRLLALRGLWRGCASAGAPFACTVVTSWCCHVLPISLPRRACSWTWLAFSLSSRRRRSLPSQ